MKHVTIIPIVLEMSLDFKRWTFGLAVIIREDLETASGLLHIGYDETFGFSFDCLYLQFIQDYLSKP